MQYRSRIRHHTSPHPHPKLAKLPRNMGNLLSSRVQGKAKNRGRHSTVIFSLGCFLHPVPPCGSNSVSGKLLPAILILCCREYSAPQTALLPTLGLIAHITTWCYPALSIFLDPQGWRDGGRADYHSVVLGQLWTMTGLGTLLRIPLQRQPLHNFLLKISVNQKLCTGSTMMSAISMFQPSQQLSITFPSLLVMWQLLPYFLITE